jgi:hypothetical protein
VAAAFGLLAYVIASIFAGHDAACIAAGIAMLVGAAPGFVLGMASK